MEDNKRISIRRHTYGINSTDFPEPCECCGSENEEPRYVMYVNGIRTTLCKKCLLELSDEADHILHKSVRKGDIVWELTLCDDGKWRIFPMIVKNVCMYGSVRYDKKGRPAVWNIYAEDETHTTYMYKNFYDAGKTLFFSEEEAQKALSGCKDRT